jgi:hypothetical protein
MEVCFYTMLLVSASEVHGEPRIELFPGVDGSWGEVHEPSPGRSRQGDMKIRCRHSGVSACCCDGGDIHLQEL